VPSRRLNPQLVKLHRSYTVPELARCMGVHKNTVRQWQREGLAPLDEGRPALFQGLIVRAFLSNRRASRKRPCPPGMLYCLRCRIPRRPALGMVDYLAVTDAQGNLRAICEDCGVIMHRRIRRAELAAKMPGLDVQCTHGSLRLSGRPSPSLNSDSERQAIRR
jgi:ribosomal protein L32